MFIYFYFILNRYLVFNLYSISNFSNVYFDYCSEHNGKVSSIINPKMSVVFEDKSSLIPARNFKYLS